VLDGEADVGGAVVHDVLDDVVDDDPGGGDVAEDPGGFRRYGADADIKVSFGTLAALNTLALWWRRPNRISAECRVR
jgi:hypothetical protein